MKRSRKNEAGKRSGSSAEETMNVEEAAPPRSRRDFLKYGGAAAAGLVAGAMLDGKEASAEDNTLKLGEYNSADEQTVLNGSAAGTSLLLVENTGGGGATSVHGFSSSGGSGLVGQSTNGIGVHGFSGGPGVFGSSTDEAGVEGNGGPFGVHGTGSSVGVLGDSEDGTGVSGESEKDVGVRGSGVQGGVFFGTTEPGVEGQSTSGSGVVGVSTNGSGVFGSGPLGGVFGEAVTGPGVAGVSEGGAGVHGQSDGFGDGVRGNHSGGGAGVAGFSEFGRGVEGQSNSGNGVIGRSPGLLASVQAVSAPLGQGGELPAPDHGVALGVIGRAAFSNAGKGSIPKDKDSSVWIEPPDGLTENSHVQVTLTNDPGGGRAVQYVQMKPGQMNTVNKGKFKVHLTPASQRKETGFTYQVNEFPPPPPL